ncbi:YkgJ family cysteine cluster protein [Desulfotomaculum copahuensis]|uniref:Uncharacterized protein n=1 Tax=Desulfotomaculum copahuensis TaxID=1838280 RepID=A0A1B7LBY7_9FIRM|nr:YkgJ family cysteine cluster protein [Desulfotomaculum copahuensis]OAT80211.1 hypothetical protein A6M21_00965 [Desulfotomaculum copahuensis]
MKIRVFNCQINGQTGYDLCVSNEEATVQDYLDAVNGYITAHCPPCDGCTSCCRERVPLTAQDVAVYLRDGEIRRLLGTGGTGKFSDPAPPLLPEFLKRFGHVYVDGAVVDIGLAHRRGGACIFLDPGRKRCTNYALRPLVCQTFICRPVSRRADELRGRLVNAGMDELVRRWLLESRRAGVRPVMHEARRPRPQLSDYRSGACSGKEYYRQLRLKDVCSPGLWRALYKS